MEAQKQEDFTFTIYGNPEIDRVIGDQVNEVTRRILRERKDVTSIFLLGGYARGEGSVLFNHGTVTPLGDYDFLVLTKFPHFSARHLWTEALERKFRIQYPIDIGLLWKALLPYLGNRIYWYEAKFGSRLLYGEKNALDALPFTDANDVDISEGISLMFNRLAGSLRVFDPQFLFEKPSEENNGHLIFQSVKLILACAESLLLLSGRYHYSYQERCTRFLEWSETDFPELFSIDPTLKDDFARATDFKLRPRYSTYNDPVGFWFEANEHAFKTMTFFYHEASKRKKEMMRSLADEPRFPEDMIEESRPDPVDFVKFNLGAISRYGSLKGIIRLDHGFSSIARASLYYLARSIGADGDVNQPLLEKSHTLLKTIIPMAKPGYSEKESFAKWVALRDAGLGAWTISRH